MSAEIWERQLRAFTARGVFPQDRETSLNPSDPKQQKQRSKPKTNVKVDQRILEDVYNLLPSSITDLSEMAESICMELNITVDTLIRAILNLQQEDRVLVEREGNQVLVMQSP